MPDQPPVTGASLGANPTAHPYERLTPDLVLDAVESTGLLSDARVMALNSYENRVYQVGVEDQAPVVVKFYRPGRWSDEQILEEHQFLWSLAETEIPVVAPQRNRDQQTLHRYADFRFAIFSRRGGHAPELDNPDNLYTLGRTLGRIHALGAAHPFSYRPSIEIDTYACQSRDLLLSRRFIPGDLSRDYQEVSTRLIERLRACFASLPNLRYLRLHGDCHVGNILWRDDAPHFVDFDDARMGPAIQDLWMLLSGDREQQRSQMTEIVEGYEEFHDFSRAELSLIEPLRTLRLMHYSAWLAARWEDPAFPAAFTWFNTPAYWMEHLMELREQLQRLDAEPLTLAPL